MRAYQDLREFLSVLEQERQLLRIADPVKLEPDLAAAACALTKLGESSPAILFNNISAYAISVMTGSLPTAIRHRQVYATRLGRDVLHLAQILLVAAGKLEELVAQRRIFFQAKREPVVGPRAVCVHRHSPKWRIARVEVEAALKGEAKGVISIRYPSSTDVRWYAVPKPKVGEDAIFILHRDGPFLGGAELAILHPMDVVRATRQELERYRRLL